DSTLVFTLPSRYIQSDLLVGLAWELFGSTPPTWARVQAVCDWVHTNISYETGSSDPTVTAMDVFERRVGVCRDFALLATAFCRGLNIPARYTIRLLPGHCRGAAGRPDGFPRVVRGLSRRPLVFVRRSSQCSAHRPRRDRSGTRRGGHGAVYAVRLEPPERLTV